MVGRRTPTALCRRTWIRQRTAGSTCTPIHCGRCLNGAAGYLRLIRSLQGRSPDGVEALLAEGDLSVQSRRELEQVHYGVRLLTEVADRRVVT